MTDEEAIQGYWRIVSYFAYGDEAGVSATHYYFGQGRFQRIASHFWDDGKSRCTYRMDEKARRIVLVEDRNGPDGPPDPNPVVTQALYRFQGNRLEICAGGNGQFPREITSQEILTTFERESGPVPQMRKPSGKKPLEDEQLGRLPWSDRLGQYCGKVLLPAGANRGILERIASVFSRNQCEIEFAIEEDTDGNIQPALKRAKTLAGKLQEYEQAAKEYAVARLLDLKNEFWCDAGEKPTNAKQFRARMTLASIVAKCDGGIVMYFHDGGLFAGHWVQIDMNAADEFVHADIPG
jgi:hypothetical protein